MTNPQLQLRGQLTDPVTGDSAWLSANNVELKSINRDEGELSEALIVFRPDKDQKLFTIAQMDSELEPENFGPVKLAILLSDLITESAVSYSPPLGALWTYLGIDPVSYTSEELRSALITKLKQ